MYSNQSDEVDQRHTGYSISDKITIENEKEYIIRPNNA